MLEDNPKDRVEDITEGLENKPEVLPQDRHAQDLAEGLARYEKSVSLNLAKKKEAQQEPPTIVLTDTVIKMPVQGMEEAVKAKKKKEKAKPLPQKKKPFKVAGYCNVTVPYKKETLVGEKEDLPLPAKPVKPAVRKPAAKKGVPKPDQRKKPVHTTRIIALVLAGVCLVVAVLAVMPKLLADGLQTASQSMSGAGVSGQGSSLSAYSAQPPIDDPVLGQQQNPDITEEVAESTPPVAEEPPIADPSILVKPAGGWPSLSFTQEEIDTLNQFFTQWAEEGQSVPAEAVSESASTKEEKDTAEKPQGNKVAVYFKDLDSGAEYIFNGEETFPVASLSKAPYAMYIYELVSQGECSLEETFLIDQDSIKGSEENSGRIKNDPNLPREYTLAELLDYLLRYSDTVAQRVLLKRYPASGFAEYAAGLGLAHPQQVRGVTSGIITAPDAGVYSESLFHYMAEGEHGNELQTLLMNTGNPMLRSQYPIARKYGWDTGAYHDMGVVYAPHPYVIAVLTDKSNGAWADTAKFASIPPVFEEIMTQKWANAPVMEPNTLRERSRK